MKKYSLEAYVQARAFGKEVARADLEEFARLGYDLFDCIEGVLRFAEKQRVSTPFLEGYREQFCEQKAALQKQCA